MHTVEQVIAAKRVCVPGEFLERHEDFVPVEVLRASEGDPELMGGCVRVRSDEGQEIDVCIDFTFPLSWA